MSAVIGSSDLDTHTLGSRGASGNQLYCSLPFKHEPSDVGFDLLGEPQPQIRDDEEGSSLIHLQWSPLIRTDDTIAGFLGSSGLNAELHTDI